MRAAFRARSCTRRGKWRGGCADCSAAAGSSISAPAMGCSRRSCSSWTTRRRRRSSSTRHCRPPARKCTRRWSQAWPRLSGRVTFVAGALDDVEILPTDVVVSSHACGALTDRVLDRAAEARARVAVLPCCHDLATCDAGELTGWVESPVAIDILRAVRLQQRGLSHLDADDPGGDDAAESSVAGRPRLVMRERPCARVNIAVNGLAGLPTWYSANPALLAPSPGGAN